jgi:hypothetical protein
MRGPLRLFIVVAEAALILTTAWFALVLVAMAVGLKPDLAPLTPTHGDILVGVTFVLTIVAAAWWLFRRLHSHWTKREARAVAVAFGIFAPISFIVAIFLSPITGGYTEMLTGRRFVGLVGAFVGIAVITALLSFIACALVLWITRRIVTLEQHDLP